MEGETPINRELTGIEHLNWAAPPSQPPQRRIMLFNYVPRNSYPKLSWLFALPFFAALGTGVYCFSQYWIGPTYDPLCNCGKVMYHDPINFAFAALMLSIAAICFFKFMLWHGPFSKS